MVQHTEVYPKPFSGKEKNKNVFMRCCGMRCQIHCQVQSEVQNKVYSVLSSMLFKRKGEDHACTLVCKCIKYASYEGRKGHKRPEALDPGGVGPGMELGTETAWSLFTVSPL